MTMEETIKNLDQKGSIATIKFVFNMRAKYKARIKELEDKIKELET